MKFRSKLKMGITTVMLIATSISNAANMPPQNNFLANSNNAMGHGTSAQQDSTYIAGPIGPSAQLDESEIDYLFLGPGHFGGNISSEYSNGKRVIWSNGLDRLVKIDHDTNRIIDTYMLPDADEFKERKAKRVIKNLDRLGGQPAIAYSLLQARMFSDLAGVYTILDNNNNYYLGTKEGIVVFGDSENDNAGSKIRVLRTWTRPSNVTGAFIGMNMTYDGRVILATEHGYVLSIASDFSEYKEAKIKYSENAADEENSTGKGWVRNGFAIDKDGGIYIASREHMHKVVWTGSKLSINEKDGAWVSPYLSSKGEGSGSTPSLMGFGDEDQFVVITDGEHLMNLTLFWRNEIPEGWERVEGAPSNRIAGMKPVDMGDPLRTALQSEQSVVVGGYGATVVNNEPNNAPSWLPAEASALLVGFLGNDPKYQPHGVQKFEWNSEEKELEVAWVNKEVSSPNAMPLVSLGSDMFYTVGARDGKWTVEGINYSTGESVFHYVVGKQTYNSLFSGVLLDENGDLFYGSIYGRVRIHAN